MPCLSHPPWLDHYYAQENFGMLVVLYCQYWLSWFLIENPVLCSSVPFRTADTTVTLSSDLLSQLLSLAVRLGGGSPCCVNHPGNLYPLKGAVWTGGSPSTRRFKVRGRVLTAYIPVGSVFGSPVAEDLGIKLYHRGSAVHYVYLPCLHTRLRLS
jgi:hypothetical protein